MLSRRISTLGVALVSAAVSLLAGCSAGQVTQTADTVAAVPGANRQVGGLSVRNVVVEYPGTEGYPAGDTAPLAVRVFNDTMQAVRLVGVESPDGQVTPGSINVEIPAAGYAVLARGSGEFLALAELTKPVKPGDSVLLTFRFDNGMEIADVRVPVDTPESPTPRSPMEFDEGVTPHE